MAGRRRLPRRNPRQTKQQIKSFGAMTARRKAVRGAQVAKAKPSPGLIRAQGATPPPAMAPRPKVFSGTQAKRAGQRKVASAARTAGAQRRATQRLITKPTVNPGYQLKAKKMARRPSGLATPKPFKPTRLGRGRRRRLR